MNNLTPVPRTPSNALISPVLQDVSTDEQLLGEWLKDLFNAGMGISQNTLSQYSLEGRRLLWFANAVERRFQAWDKPTANAYLTFLASPPEHAIGDSRTKNSGAWRPFRKPPSAASVKQSAIIARSFFNWLVDQQAIRVNPLPRPPRSRENRGPGTQQRYLNITQLKAVFDAIAARPAEMFWDRLKQDRDRMVIALAFQTGLRASEMAELRWSDFQRRDGKHGPYWVIVVRHAKSGDNQVVPCDAAMEEISAFRRTIGLGPEPEGQRHDSGHPLHRRRQAQACEAAWQPRSATSAAARGDNAPRHLRDRQGRFQAGGRPPQGPRRRAQRRRIGARFNPLAAPQCSHTPAALWKISNECPARAAASGHQYDAQIHARGDG